MLMIPDIVHIHSEHIIDYRPRLCQMYVYQRNAQRLHDLS